MIGKSIITFLLRLQTFSTVHCDTHTYTTDEMKHLTHSHTNQHYSQPSGWVSMQFAGRIITTLTGALRSGSEPPSGFTLSCSCYRGCTKPQLILIPRSTSRASTKSDVPYGRKLKNGRAPGPDGIPSELLKCVISSFAAHPGLEVRTYSC